MNEAHAWVYDRLRLLHCRAHGLPDPVPPEPLPAPAVAEQVAEIAPEVAKVLEILVMAGVRPGENESLAQALARTLFDADGTPSALGVAFFGGGEQ